MSGHCPRVIAIVGLLIFAALPVFAQARDAARYVRSLYPTVDPNAAQARYSPRTAAHIDLHGLKETRRVRRGGFPA